jgi:hypothetical protein
MSVYVLDSNFFIQAHRAYYPMDVAIGFWVKVRQLAEQGKIISIDKVKKELYDKNDVLEDWCRNNLPADFFKDTSALVQTSYPQVIAWAISRQEHYTLGALNEFLDADEADAFLVAYGHADAADRCIVTQEVSEPNRKTKIKIPEACTALNVQ